VPEGVVFYIPAHLLLPDTQTNTSPIRLSEMRHLKIEKNKKLSHET